MDKIYFVLPAYNEEANIKDVIDAWYPIVKEYENGGARLVIANDGSKDDTYKILSGLQANYPLLDALDKPNSGHGSTILFLYNYAIEKGADFVFQTDSDGQTNPNEFEQMYINRNEYDFQIGYRKERQDGSNRIFVTKILQIVVWLMFHVWVTDANTPFRLMKTDRLKKILKVIPNDYFLANVAISAIAVKWKERVQFYKITFLPRQGGENSINIKKIIKIGWKALSDFRIINRNLR